LSIILMIVASLAVLIRKYSTKAKARNAKLALIAISIPFLVLVVWFVMPQWFDAVARSFPDPNLKAMVRDEIGKPPGYAGYSDLKKITQLNSGNYMGIKKLNGLQHCTGLTDLELSANQIRDISPLTELTSLKTLDLTGNPLNSESVNVYIPELRHRGVRVDY